MKLLDIFQRNTTPRPWAEGEKIPWNDPTFSRRMLKEHLSQKHDAASRRTAKIKKQVDWIHNFVLGGKPSRILDLGCGPGLYSARLSALEHACRGIDFGPASITYALEHAPAGCSYTLGDIRTTDRDARSADGRTGWIQDSTHIRKTGDFTWATDEIRSPHALVDGGVLRLYFAGHVWPTVSWEHFAVGMMTCGK